MEIIKQIVKYTSIIAILMIAMFIIIRYFPWQVSYEHSVFKVVTLHNQNVGGTGFLINTPANNTYLITNAHVCYNAIHDGQMLAFNDRYRDTTTVFILKTDYYNDLCLLSWPRRSSGLQLAANIVDKNVSVYGFPLLESFKQTTGILLGIQSFYIAYTVTADWSVAATCQIVPNRQLVLWWSQGRLMWHCLGNFTGFALTAPIEVGSSGSPIIDRNGKVLGIIVGRNTQTRTSYGATYLQIYNFIKEF